MAAAKGRPTGKGGKPPKKGIGAKMPTKRSINLVLVDENKINPVKAALGIILIVALAVAFSKFMVADRLLEMSRATSRVSQLRSSLDETMALIQGFGEVEETYAHYTLDGMSKAELGRVDRGDVGNLVSDIIREQDNLFDMNAYEPRLDDLVVTLFDAVIPNRALREFRSDVATLGEEIVALREQVLSWSVSENVLTVEVTGKSLESLNQLAREIEESPMVDSCTLSTANKNAQSRKLTGLDSGVRGKFVVYLIQPPEEEVADS